MEIENKTEQKDGLLFTYSTNRKYLRAPRKVLDMQHRLCS